MDLNRLFHLRPEDPLSLKELMSILHPTQEIDHKLLNLHLVGILTGTESQLFKNIDGFIYPEDGISLKNETEICSKSVLSNYSQLASRVYFLLDSINKCLINEDDNVLTRISYSLTLRDILNQCFEKLLLDSQQLTMPVNYFSDYLNGKKSGFLAVKLNTLYEIGMALSDGSDCSSKILNILMDFIYLDRIHEFNIVSQLLISSIRPCLDYIESLLTNGIVKDCRGEFFFQTNCDCDPDHFWSDVLQFDDTNPVPVIFNSSWEYLCMGIKSRLLINIFEQRNRTIKIDYPRGCLFEHFLRHLKQIYHIVSNDNINHIKSTKKKNHLKLRLDMYEELFPLNYEFLTIDDKLESDVEDLNFSSIENMATESFLPSDYTRHGIPFEIALQKSLTATLKTFIDPISQWLIEHSHNSYQLHLNIFNDYYLLQRSNPEMRLYFEALFSDITEGCTKPESALNWHYYTFTEHDVTAFLSQQRLNGKKVKNLTIIENIHLIYEEMDWTSRAIINNNSKMIYDKAFQFLLLLTYCRWILDNLRLPRNIKQRTLCYAHKLYLIRHRLLLTANNLYNFIMNNVHQQVILLYKSLDTACDYQDLKNSFVKFIRRIELITMQRSDSNSKVVRTMVRKFVQLVDSVATIWSNPDLESCELPEKSEIENFEKGFKIYLYNIAFIDDHIILKS
ncbi:uncharacterized protein LOC107364631 [Tetranychus urticae]|uniref:uncharacterized protein LOC107364631 n=1 Tax=Tetranychus urticae TaxID=32264 RepID=UPI00077BF435|nr:uncharacterized protein LOC107364631 [Tetranychus urticae]